MAVYTDVSAEDLTRFLSGYNIGELLSYKGIAEGVENSNFLVHTSTGNFILTLYEKRVAEDDLPFFLGLMEHLAARGITCPQPVKNKHGGLLGKIAAHRVPPDIDQAATNYHQALTLADELGMRPLQAHCHRGLGTLYAKIGQQEPARIEVSAASKLYRAMDMTFWLPQAEAALAQVEER